MREFNKKQLLEYLRSMIAYRQSASRVAKRLGVSRSYFSEVLAGKKEIGPTILKALKVQIVYKFY